MGTSPADDCDPVTGFISVSGHLRPVMVYLSDRDGITRTYEFSFMGHRAVNVKEPIEQPHAHPTLDALNEDVIVARKVDGISNIYEILFGGKYIPLTDSNSFDGHPAGGPVWWRPDLEIEW